MSNGERAPNSPRRHPPLTSNEWRAFRRADQDNGPFGDDDDFDFGDVMGEFTCKGWVQARPPMCRGLHPALVGELALTLDSHRGTSSLPSTILLGAMCLCVCLEV